MWRIQFIRIAKQITRIAVKLSKRRVLFSSGKKNERHAKTKKQVILLFASGGTSIQNDERGI